jgi:hypothetical protein
MLQNVRLSTIVRCLEVNNFEVRYSPGMCDPQNTYGTNSVAPEPEPYSQQPATGPYPEPDEPAQHLP